MYILLAGPLKSIYERNFRVPNQCCDARWCSNAFYSTLNFVFRTHTLQKQVNNRRVGPRKGLSLSTLYVRLLWVMPLEVCAEMNNFTQKLSNDNINFNRNFQLFRGSKFKWIIQLPSGIRTLVNDCKHRVYTEVTTERKKYILSKLHQFKNGVASHVREHQNTLFLIVQALRE